MMGGLKDIRRRMPDLRAVAMAVLCLVLAVPGTPAHAVIKDISDAINVAGRQRMLSQRMFKAYCMIGIDVQGEDARQELDEAVAQFDAQLQDLIAYAPTQDIRNALLRVETMWRGFRREITATVDLNKAIALLKDNEVLLQHAHRVVLLLEAHSRSPIGRLVNVSGRQRMLSQRIAKFYMLRAWGMDDAQVRNEMEQAKNEFMQALAELQTARENTPAIKQSLEKADNEWRLLKHGLERNQQTLVPLIVITTSEQLLRRMNEITAMYAALPNSTGHATARR